MHGIDEHQVFANDIPLLEPDPQSLIAWTRLMVPQQGSTYLERSRLIDTLHNMVDRKLILVRAPAGYGKTSLLADLARETDLQTCWYTLGEQDADLSIFLTCLIACIARRFPSFGQRSLQLLRSMEGRLHSRLRVLVATVVDEIFREIPEYFFLVLDDYHTLQDTSHVHEFVRLLLDLMPEQCHVIVASRTVPPLPLIRLAARQQMAAIGVDDLRFDGQEIHQLAREKLGISLTAEQARFLAQQTDGWITAILLSADAGWDAFLSGDRSTFAGLTETGIYDYLMSEVFSCQPPEIQSFLLRTAVLSEMTVSLCDQLIQADSRDALYLLEKNNLFISSVGDVGIEATYRYHPLFRDFLLTRLRQQSEPLFGQLNAQAADLFEGQQRWPAAILHNLNAGRFAHVRQAILSHYDDLNRAGLRESVANWIDALPLEHLSPDLRLRRAQLATELGQIDTALRLYANVIVLFESQENTPKLAMTLLERSYALSKSGHSAEAIQDCQEALSLLADEPEADSLRGRAYRHQGIFYEDTGDPGSALRSLSLARECWNRCGEAPVRMARLAQDMGAAYGMLGQLEKAIEEYTRALQVWTHLANDGEIGLTLAGIGVARHRLGEYGTALKVLREAWEKSQAAGDVRADAYVLTSLGDLYRDLGQFDQALDCYLQGSQEAEVIGEAYLQSYAASARTEVLYLAGQTESAQAEIQHALSRGSLSRSAEARYRLALAITLLDRRESQQARAELDAALSLPGTEGDIAFRGRIQLARAAMLEHQPQETRDQLHAAFQFAQEAGLTQPLSVESLQYIHVLQFAAKEGEGSPEIDRWIAAAGELERTREQLSSAERVRTTGSRYPLLQIGALGGSQVLMDEDAVSWRTTQAKELFFYLLTHPNGQTKEQIGATIWPEHPSAKLFSIFRSSLFRVRKALFTEIVLVEENRYRLNDEISFRYDVQMFQQEISRGTLADNPVQRAHHYRRAAELYRGEFLADMYADWVLPFREALQARCLQALTFLGEFNLDRGQYPVAIEFSRKILAVDEYHELAFYILIRAYARSGQRPQAKRIYDQCRSMLAEFGFSPQQSLEDLLR
ncbi:MAG: hypothetical protein ISS56_03875 [Anaerolineae bacterium]|nr:hypothetical protein [Anaerolineae bacterium]